MCRRCNDGCNDCKCTCTKRCINERCDCPIYLSSNCITEFTEDLPCSGILKGQTLNETIIALDAYICEKFGSVSAFFALVNVGDGAEVYKGVNVLGQKEIKTLVEEGLITITEQTNTVTITVDEEALETFIQENQLTYSASNVGEEGAAIYAGNTTTANNTNFEFRTIKSDTLTITQNETDISIEQATSTTIPALYVNSAFLPSYSDWFNSGGDVDPDFLYKGEGTLARPFTNTRNYTSPTTFVDTPNTAIQNALDVYVGEGTRINPDLQGQQIIVQNNNSGGYTFAGDFSYSALKLVVESGANVSSTTTGYLVDMDDPTYFNEDEDTCYIEVQAGSTLTIIGEGFLNSGSTVATNNFQLSRVLNLKLDGLLFSNVNDPDKYIFTGDPLGTVNGTTGCNNDGNYGIRVEGNITSVYQGVYKIGGKSRIEFLEGQVVSGNPAIEVDEDLKVFHQTGGFSRFSKTTLTLEGGDVRLMGFTFNSLNSFIPTLDARGVTTNGYARNWFDKITNSQTNFDWQNGEYLYMDGSFLFNSPNMWSVTFKYNNLAVPVNFEFMSFNQDLGVGSTNILGNSVIETLPIYATKEQAVDAGVSRNTAFIKRRTVLATDLVEGQEYMILTVGTTNFTLVGAGESAVGVYFTANATPGLGTGTVSIDTREVLV